MIDLLAIEEVGPFSGDTEETYDYTRCDCCSETACHDLWAGTREPENWRLFYRVQDAYGNDLVVCGNCLPELGGI